LATTAVIPAAASAQTFTDVPENHDYAEAINTLANSGIISGYSDGTFRMGELLTRAEASVIAANFFKSYMDLDSHSPAAPLVDVKQDAWYADSINALYEAGIIRGTGDNQFEPNATMTRAEVSQLLYEAYGIPAVPNVVLPFTDVAKGAWYEEPIKALYGIGVISGQTPTTFGPNDDMKRGDFAWMLYHTYPVFFGG